MRHLRQKFTEKFFGEHLDFRTQLFNLMHLTGAATSTFMAIVCVITPWRTYLDVFWLMSITTGVLALLRYARKSGNYRTTAIVTTIYVFFCILPTIFLTGTGGYRGGVVFFFIFCVVFTVSMLKGRPMIVMIALELTAYISVCSLVFFYPGLARPFEREIMAFLELVICLLVVSVMLAFVLSLYIRLYDKQQHELEIARKLSEEHSRMKSDLFSMISHEMRTPLTVMSAFAQYAVEQIKADGGINEETLADLNAISDESKRLAKMADSTLGIMKTFRGTDGGDLRKNDPVDIGALVERLLRLLKPAAARKTGCALTANIKGGGIVTGDDGALTQLLWNILQNAIAHSGAKTITVAVETEKDAVLITIEDDGAGIPPDLLPRVFEHGVSGSPTGSGIGLYVCREIVKRHGGEITVACDAEKGTRVSVSLESAIVTAASP